MGYREEMGYWYDYYDAEIDFREPPVPELTPSDDDLMTQYDNEVLDEDYEEVDGPDPDKAYDQWREARIWGT